jgi:hypothetical protein
MPAQAIFKFEKGRYYSAIYFLEGREQDWMACVFRDLPDGKWRFTYRFRYYVDEKIHGSDDKRSVYDCSCGDSTEQEVLSAVSKAANMLVETGYSPSGRIHKLRPCTDDPMKLGEMLAREDWAHVKTVGVDRG